MSPDVGAPLDSSMTDFFATTLQDADPALWEGIRGELGRQQDTRPG